MRTDRTARDDLLARIIEHLSNDDRFIAAWLTGSFARGNADALSDLDLTLVVSDQHSAALCRRAAQVSHQTTPERLELFSRFGTPAIIHENNNNAPEGGTFTFVLYAHSAVMIDWTIVPNEQALKPTLAVTLFEKSVIPEAPPPAVESLDERARKAAEISAFFWMMMAITSKYIARNDPVFVTCWLEELHRMLRETDRLVAGRSWEYQRGSLGSFETTPEGQKQAVLCLGEKMENLLPELTRIGAQVLPSPMKEIRTFLEFISDIHHAKSQS